MDMDFASSPVEPPLFSPDVDDVDGLAQAPAPWARAILVALCENPRVRAEALRQLGRLLRFEADVRGQDAVKSHNSHSHAMSNPTSNPSLNPKKRKATGEPKICVQCDCIFTDDENDFGMCWYHSGELELMDETIIDVGTDEMSVYDLDNEANRAQYPEAYRWCCCHRLGDRQGCVRGRHESNPDRSRKGRGEELSDPDDDPLELDASYHSHRDENSQENGNMKSTSGEV